MTIREFLHFVNHNLEKGSINMETPLGVFSSLENKQVNIARIKDSWVPPDGTIIVLSPFFQKDILCRYGFAQPECN